MTPQNSGLYLAALLREPALAPQRQFGEDFLAVEQLAAVRFVDALSHIGPESLE